ncbi:MAG TPA: DNA-formamidopyrimidine glycosylase [Candidatus Paceibacterota bacterium]
MPELPEVTTTVNGLNETVKGKTILDVWSDWPKSVKTPSFPKFKKGVRNKKIVGAVRCGKNILVNLSSGQTILIHMKMTGHLLYGKYKLRKGKFAASESGPLLDDPYNRFIHLVFTLSGGKHLAFSDARKFGKIKLLEKGEVKTCKDLKSIGPDALSVTRPGFAKLLGKKSRGKIKQVLMNQEVVAGIGNIYSDEMLWLAGIHPEAKAGEISQSKVALLYKSMRQVLQKGIRFNGDSLSDYRDIHGNRGKFQNHHSVYQKKGEKCAKNDGGTIERKIVGGRSAHFCPTHQFK